MYTIICTGEGAMEARGRRVVSELHRRGERLPEYFLAPEVMGGPPVRVDGFLVLGTHRVLPGELCLVTTVGRPGVRFVRR